MEDKQEITSWKPNPFEGTDLLPAAFDVEGADRGGRENIESEDIVVPVLVLLQGLSKAVRDKVPDAEPGKFYNTVTGEVFDSPLRVLVCGHTRGRSMFPKENQTKYAGLERCLSKDGITGDVYGDCGVCAHKNWPPKGQGGPPCSVSNNFYLMAPGRCVIRMSRSSFNSSKDFVSTWNDSPFNCFHFAAMLTAVAVPKTVDGIDTTYYEATIRWMRKEPMPDAVKSIGREVQDQVRRAHEAGRLKTDGDDGDLDLD